MPGDVCTLTLVFVSSQGEQKLLTGQIRTKGGDTDRMFAVSRITPIPAGFVYRVLEMSNEDLFFVLNPFRYCLLWHRWNGLRKPFDRHSWPEIAHFCFFLDGEIWLGHVLLGDIVVDINLDFK